MPSASQRFVRLHILVAVTLLALTSAETCSEGETLPFPPSPMGGTIGTSMLNSKHKWRKQTRRLPDDAPNIVIIMFDDAGFGQSSAFGGKINTPNLAKLKGEGISYNAFHTTAMCSPTRASVLTGRNHNRVGAGQVAEFANDWDGYSGEIPKTSATIAAVLRHYGYGTAAVGKDHNTPVDCLGTGPFKTPRDRGFDYFYGFLAGESSQWEPMLWENDAQISTPRVKNHEDYHFTEDMADKAIAWMRKSRALHPERPFLLWWTPGAVHGPHHVASKWADRYAGQFAGGWDAYQKEVFDNQKSMGWIPESAVRSPRPEEMPAWDTLDPKEKAFQERLMEVYAGFLEHTDAQAGKVVDALTEMGIRNNTLIIQILADNGASAEGISGTIAELNTCNGIPSTFEDHYDYVDKIGGLSQIGGPKTDNMYHSAWAWAGNCPFRYTKLVGADWGGTRTPMVISWPDRVKPDTTLRQQFHHVTDIAPTIYEILGITPPKVVDGFEQDPMDGTSLLYTFGANGATLPTRKETQYFDIWGSRGIYHQGYFASTFGPRKPWVPKFPDLRNWDPDQDTWELFDYATDFTLMNDISSEKPEKLKEMKDIFMQQAVENKVLPIGGGLYTLLNPKEFKKTLNTEWRLYGGMTRIPESEAPNVRSGSLRAEITAEVPAGVNGVVFAMGGYAGGVSMYALRGELYYEYSALLLRRYKKKIGTLPPGKVNIDFEMRTTPGRATPANLKFWINGNLSEMEVGRTVPAVFAGNEGFDVGVDLGSPVADDYYENAPFEFEGKNLKLHFTYDF